MVLIALIKEAMAALWANRLRSGLTVLGMVMGVMSVTTIVSAVEGMQTNMKQAFMSLGPNTFIVTRFGIGMNWAEYLERMRRKKLTRGLIPLIEDGCPDCDEVGAEGYASSHLKYGRAKMRWVEIRGQTPNIHGMRDLEIGMGRFLSWEDDNRRRNVAFLGHKVYERFFVNEDPIGKKIKAGDEEFTVIGVAEKVGGLFGQEMDEYICIPLSTHQKIYRQPGNPVNIVVRAVSLEQRERAMDEARVVLRSARRVSYNQDDDFSIITPDGILSFIDGITRAFRVVLISLPLLSIVVGGIVIMNIMMISVTERTREIGIRKSLGACKRHILAQFLYESVILSVIGGAIGVGLGIQLGDLVLSSWMDIVVAPSVIAIVLGLGISTAVGLFFGVYPAMKAARLDPIAALSYE